MASAHPILSNQEALVFEKKILTSAPSEWEAMRKAGRALAHALLADFAELQKNFPEAPRILVLAGKGHNAGDALIAAREIQQQYPAAEVFVIFAFRLSEFRPLALKAYEQVKTTLLPLSRLEDLDFDLCIDGLLGMHFRPPVQKRMRSVLEKVNAHPGIRFRAAVDVPSGLGDYAFRADFTYATGIAKVPLFLPEHAQQSGRIRYLDIGFFDTPYRGERSFQAEVLAPSILDSFKTLRSPFTDKRSYGHLFILAGSRGMPGALLMSVRAALQSGVGLLTVFAPESVIAAFSAAVPEAMWVPWPETPEGGLALEGSHLLKERLGKSDALLIGPGMGQCEETQFLIQDLVKTIDLPILLDADALTEKTAEATAMRPEGFGPVVMTPHEGELLRMAGDAQAEIDCESLKWFAHKNNAIVLLKGPVTRITDGEHLVHSLPGGPVLARGGSGDLLAGLLGGVLASQKNDAFTAVCQAAYWHGSAADLLARERGQFAVSTTQLLDYLSPVIHE